MQIRTYVFKKIVWSSVAALLVYLAAKAIFSSLYYAEFRSEQRRYVSRIVVDSLRVPILQGSMVEVKSRLENLKKNSLIACARLEMADLEISNCGDYALVARAEPFKTKIFFDEETKKHLAATLSIFSKPTALFELISYCWVAIQTRQIQSLVALMMRQPSPVD